MSEVKVRGLFYPEALPKVRNGKKKRDGFCKNCGKKLSDEVSLARGFGHDCFSKIPVLVVLEIQSGGTTQLAPDAAPLLSELADSGIEVLSIKPLGGLL